MTSYCARRGREFVAVRNEPIFAQLRRVTLGWLKNRMEMQRLLISAALCALMWWGTKPAEPKQGLTQMEKRAQRERWSHAVVSNTSHSLGFWLKEGRSEEFSPHIIWFLSWPTSGDEYVLSTMEHVSNKSLSTNYGEEVTPDGYPSIPIYPRHPEGPFWEGLGSPFGGKIRALPLDYVWTKTHCNSRCYDCPPKDYKTDLKSFMSACRRTTAQVGPDGHLEEFHYPVEHVHKAVHMIRNPFHNLIQRFVAEREAAEKRGDKKWLEEYPLLPKKGFQKWCNMLDDKYKREDEEAFKESKQIMKTMCRSEVYKYIQWHNHAFAATEELGIDSLVVYYEDFYDKFDETVASLLEFAGHSRQMLPRNFSKAHNYSRFYEPDQRRDFRRMARELASRKTWKHLSHFFDRHATFW